MVHFWTMNEAEMRDWINQHAEKVKITDAFDYKLLFVAAHRASPSFVAELVDKYGAHVNFYTSNGLPALHYATSVATVSVLLERGADPAAVKKWNETSLTGHVRRSSVDCVGRLLQEMGTLTREGRKRKKRDRERHEKRAQ